MNRFNQKTEGILNFADLRLGKYRVLYWLAFAFMVLIFLICLLPVVWVFLSSFKSPAEMYSIPPTIFPEEYDFGNVFEVLSHIKLGSAFKSSIIIIIGSIVVEVFSCGMLGYVITKIKPVGYQVVDKLIFWSMLLPSISLLPLYMFYVDAKLIGSYWPLWMSAGAQAFTVFLFKNFFNGIPTGYIEAARIDGCGELGVFFRIIMPLSKPILACVAIRTTTRQWGNFLWPYLILGGTDMEPISVKLYQLNLNVYLPMNELLMVAMFAIIPPFLMYCFLSEQITGGLNMSGIKG